MSAQDPLRKALERVLGDFGYDFPYDRAERIADKVLAALSRQDEPGLDAYDVRSREWWPDGRMVNCGLPGDEGFVGDAETPEDAQTIADQHNTDLRELALHPSEEGAAPPGAET